MGVSGISATADARQGSLLGAIQQRNGDLDALRSSLGANDLTGAQTAFAALLNDRQQIQGLRQSQGITTTTRKPVVDDLNTLQSALKSGDLSSAKADLAKLLTDLQQAQKHRHHHGGARSSAASIFGSSDGDADDASSGAASGFDSIDLQI